MKIHRQLTAAAFLFISMGNHGTSAMQQKGSKRENEASGRLANFQS